MTQKTPLNQNPENNMLIRTEKLIAWEKKVNRNEHLN
jgi:hypothetical protein